MQKDTISKRTVNAQPPIPYALLLTKWTVIVFHATQDMKSSLECVSKRQSKPEIPTAQCSTPTNRAKNVQKDSFSTPRVNALWPTHSASQSIVFLAHVLHAIQVTLSKAQPASLIKTPKPATAHKWAMTSAWDALQGLSWTPTVNAKKSVKTAVHTMTLMDSVSAVTLGSH